MSPQSAHGGIGCAVRGRSCTPWHALARKSQTSVVAVQRDAKPPRPASMAVAITTRYRAAKPIPLPDDQVRPGLDRGERLLETRMDPTSRCGKLRSACARIPQPSDRVCRTDAARWRRENQGPRLSVGNHLFVGGPSESITKGYVNLWEGRTGPAGGSSPRDALQAAARCQASWTRLTNYHAWKFPHSDGFRGGQMGLRCCGHPRTSFSVATR
jgi:hypothetical protein